MSDYDFIDHSYDVVVIGRRPGASFEFTFSIGTSAGFGIGQGRYGTLVGAARDSSRTAYSW